jgi:hypothetical protein
MSNLNYNNAVTGNNPTDLAAPLKDTDSISGNETEYMNTDWSKQWGYFNECPELKSAILMKATWNVGKGYTCKNPKDEVILDLITGTGKSTFLDILFNMEVTRRLGRDAYCEVIRDEKSGMLLNLKPINTGTMKHIYDKKGILKRYEQIVNGKIIKFEPDEIFHLSNNMLVDQCRGISDIESLDKTLIAELESFSDTKELMKRVSRPFIIFKLKTDNTTKINDISAKVEQIMNKNKSCMFIPDDENILSYEVVQINPSQLIFAWRNEISNRFYRALGMPLIIFGAANSTESGSKMEYFAHEQVFEHDQKYIEEQVWRQLKVRIDLIPPTSMAPELAQDTMKDGPAQGITTQPNDVQAGVGQ